MKKIIALILAAILVVALFAACGKSGDGDDKQSDKTVESAEGNVESGSGDSNADTDPEADTQLPEDTETERESEEETEPVVPVLEVEGRYVIKFVDGENVEDYLAGTGISAEDVAYIDLKIGGIAIVVSSGVEYEGTWERSGEVVSVKIEGEAMDFTLRDNQLIGDFDGEDGIFEKKTDSGENSEDEPDDSTATWSAEFVGTYVLKTIGGKTVKEYLEEIADLPEGESIEDYLTLFGIESFDEFMVLELKAGGEATLTTSGDSDYPTWVKDGNKIVLSYEGEEEVLDVNGNELSIEIDGELFVLVRQ